MLTLLKTKLLNRLKRLRPHTSSIIPVDKEGFWETRRFPTRSLRLAARQFDSNHGRTIIEIGTGMHGGSSGNSMGVWAAKTKATRIVGVDLEPRRLEEVKSAIGHDARVELVLENGIDYLAAFTGEIDLLYLDFWTDDPTGTLPGTGRAEAYKEAYLAAREKLRRKSLILIDDTDHIHPWKHTYIIPLAREDGYRVLYTGRQTLLMRD